MFEPNQRRYEIPRQIRVGQWCAVLLPANAYQVRYVTTSATIGFAYDAQTGVHAYASDRIRPFRALPNSLAYVPEGCDVLSESCVGGEYLCLSHDESIPDVVASEDRFNNVIDDEAIKIAHALRYLLLRNDFFDPLIIEYEALCLAWRVREYLAVKPVLVSKYSAMTERQLRLVDELIEAHLSERLSIGFLAKSLGVSAGYFSRAFRNTVGQSPFNYVIDRRVSRARQLIHQIHRDLSGVACVCGFASHAHMTETFRQRLGLSPSQLRMM